MKVAILLVGQPRFFRQNDTILELKNKYDADVFIHTWNIKESNKYVSPYAPTIWNSTPKDVEEYILKYEPKEYLIEDELTEEFINSNFIDREITRYSHPASKNNLYRWFYSVNKCADLAMKHSYDVYIIVRPDLLIHRLPEIDSDKIMSPTIHNHDETLPSHYIEISLMSVPNKYIEEYINIINRFDEYYDKGYGYAHDHMPFAHLYESGLINNTRQYNLNDFYWRLIRSEDGSIMHSLH